MCKTIAILMFLLPYIVFLARMWKEEKDYLLIAMLIATICSVYWGLAGFLLGRYGFPKGDDK